MKILTASLNMPVGDWPKTLKLIFEAIDEAIEKECSILAFSELTLANIDARDYLKCLTNVQICSHLYLIADYAYKNKSNLMIFIGHPWRGYSADATSENRHLPLSHRDKHWNAYTCLHHGDIIGMSLKQHLDTYLSRLEERDYIGASKIGITQITLPKTVYYNHNKEKKVMAEKIISVGNKTFPLEFKHQHLYIYPVIGDQTFLIAEYYKAIQQEHGSDSCIILNPSATPSTNKTEKQHNALIDMMKNKRGLYIRINSLGGMNNGSGDILACRKNTIIEQVISAPFVEKFTCVIDTMTQHQQRHFLFSPQLLTIRSQVRWLFDYLSSTTMSPIRIILPITDDITSIYHLYLLYYMIRWHARDRKENSEIALSERIICVYLRNHPDNKLDEDEAECWSKSIGAEWIAHDADSLIQGIKTIIPFTEQHELIQDLHELTHTVLSLSVANYKNGIGIANITIDDLVQHPRFGGKLHQGQLSPSSSLYRQEIFDLLNALIETECDTLPQKDALKNRLRIYSQSTQRQEDIQFKKIAQSLLNPQTNGEKTIIQETEHFYRQWQSAQYGIHTTPLTLNHNQQAIEHNMGMRIPPIHVFNAKIPKIVRVNKAGKKSSASTRLPIHNTKETIPFKITQASCNQTGGDWENNIHTIFHAIDIAVDNNSDLLALPELVLSGYDCEDRFLSMSNNILQSLLHSIAHYAANKDPNLLISIGHPWILSDEDNPKNNPHHKPFNVQSLLGRANNGEARILMMKFKGDLYGEGRGFERRHFACETDGDTTLWIAIPERDGKTAYKVPFGRKLVARIGNPDQGYFDCFQSICEEFWKRSIYDDGSEKYYSEYNIISEINRMGYNIGLYISSHASPPSPNKLEKQKHLTKLASLHGHRDMVVIYTDNLGTSGASYVNAGARYAAQHGKIIMEADGIYSFKKISHTTAVYFIPRAKLNESLHHIACLHDFKNHSPTLNTIKPDIWRTQPSHEIEAAIRNQLLFLYDTMKKSRVRCFTQALSGGADSAWNAVKIRLLVELGIQELGLSEFLRSLYYPESDIVTLRSIDNNKEIIAALMKRMLICYYLATQNNSTETESAARHLIENGIGGSFVKITIQPLVNQLSLVLLNLKQKSKKPSEELLDLLSTFLSLRNDTTGKKKYTELNEILCEKFGDWHGVLLSSSQPSLGITIENSQARIRQLVMSFLTKIIAEKPHLLSTFLPRELIDTVGIGTCFGLSNPNENEGRRAYTTFGGDLHSGEINPNGQIPKDEQLQQMHYICQKGLYGLTPITALEPILHQTPSAELQPKDAQGHVTQFDEKALGLPFKEATIINHARAHYTHPLKVLKICQAHEYFINQNIATIHDKIIISYRAFAGALHKLVAAPNMPTYGEYTTSSKSSMQYPLISTHERYELAGFTLYCLNHLAIDRGSDFFTLTGSDFDFCYQRSMFDEKLASALENAMYTANCHDGLPYKLENLYAKIIDAGSIELL